MISYLNFETLANNLLTTLPNLGYLQVAWPSILNGKDMGKSQWNVLHGGSSRFGDSWRLLRRSSGAVLPMLNFWKTFTNFVNYEGICNIIQELQVCQKDCKGWTSKDLKGQGIWGFKRFFNGFQGLLRVSKGSRPMQGSPRAPKRAPKGFQELQRVSKGSQEFSRAPKSF